MLKPYEGILHPNVQEMLEPGMILVDTKTPTAPLFRLGRKPDPWIPPDWSRAQPDGTYCFDRGFWRTRTVGLVVPTSPRLAHI